MVPPLPYLAGIGSVNVLGSAKSCMGPNLRLCAGAPGQGSSTYFSIMAAAMPPFCVEYRHSLVQGISPTITLSHSPITPLFGDGVSHLCFTPGVDIFCFSWKVRCRPRKGVWPTFCLRWEGPIKPAGHWYVTYFMCALFTCLRGWGVWGPG